MTEAVTRRGFVFGVAAGASAAAAGPAAAQEGTDTDAGTQTGGGTEADGGATGTDGGTAGAGGDGGGGGGGEPAFDGWFDDVSNYDGNVADLRGEESPEVDVGVENGSGPYGFGPPAVHVDNGATLTWTWTGQGGAHNVVEDGEGVFDSGQPVSGEGETFEYTFEEDGIYKYVCEPHVSLEMKGAVVVGTDYPSAGGGGGDGGGGSRPQVPDAARSLGLATAFAMAATLGLTYFFIKYGGDYAGFEEA